jgi:hypothetical protein
MVRHGAAACVLALSACTQILGVEEGTFGPAGGGGQGTCAFDLPDDCVKPLCEGGTVTQVPNDEEIPADDPDKSSNSCLERVCRGGTGYPTKPAGSPCNNGGTCNESGLCSTCDDTHPCGSTNCSGFMCVNETCMPVNPQTGTISDGVQGNCQGIQCDGTGNTGAIVFDPADPAPPSDPCHTGVCQASGQTTYQVTPVGGACYGQQGVCNSFGNCVGCIGPEHCPPGDVCSNQACCTPIPDYCDAIGAQCGTFTEPACGQEINCGWCANPAPICVGGNACMPCSVDAECAGHALGSDCYNGRCRCLTDMDCDEPSRPHCAEAGIYDYCVECEMDSHCAPPEPRCDTITHACVQCLSDGDCTAPTPSCNVSLYVCQ